MKRKSFIWMQQKGILNLIKLAKLRTFLQNKKVNIWQNHATNTNQKTKKKYKKNPKT